MVNKSQSEAELLKAAATPSEESWADILEYQYVNRSQTYGSNWDIHFAFGETLPSGTMRPKVGVVMSHQQAKAFHSALGDIISKIEGALGHPIAFNPKTVSDDVS